MRDMGTHWECYQRGCGAGRAEKEPISFPHNFILSIAREIKERAGADVGDDSWNPEAHIELTLTAKECRTILDAVGISKGSTLAE